MVIHSKIPNPFPRPATHTVWFYMIPDRKRVYFEVDLPLEGLGESELPVAADSLLTTNYSARGYQTIIHNCMEVLDVWQNKTFKVVKVEPVGISLRKLSIQYLRH